MIKSLAAAICWAIPLLSPAEQPMLYDAMIMWETPVSHTRQPSVTNFYSNYENKKRQESLKIAESKGPAQSVNFLKNETAPSLINARANFHYLAGNYDKAIDDFQAVLSSKDWGPARSGAITGLRACFEKKAQKEPEFYTGVFESYKNEWHNERAIKLLPQIYKSKNLSDKTKKELKKIEPVLAMRIGLYDQSIELLKNAKSINEMRWLALAKMKKGDFIGAGKKRIEIAGKLKGKQQNQELRTAFLLFCRFGSPQKAIDLAEKYPTLKAYDDFQWHIAIAALKSGDTGSAKQYFEKICTDTKLHKQHQKAYYFWGRALEMEAKHNQARALFQKTASGPFNYYKILAEGRLETTNTSSSLAFRLAQLMENGPEGRDQASVGYHLWITEKGVTREELATAMAELGSQDKIFYHDKKDKAAAQLNIDLIASLNRQNTSELLDLIRANEKLKSKNLKLSGKAATLWHPVAATVAAEEGDYRTAISFFSRIKSKPSNYKMKKWGHPLVFNRQILKAHRELGLAPQLLLALIRTESAYENTVISVSNAHGLMQLLPVTAEKVSALIEHAIKSKNNLWLFDPDNNIRLGSWYLNELIKGFDNLPLALASYNGGPYNIKQLIETQKPVATDIFIETLPIDENSNYVRRILEHRYVYEAAYLGETTTVDLTMPVRAPGKSLPNF